MLVIKCKQITQKCRHSLEMTTADSWVGSLVEWNFMMSFAAVWMVERTGEGGEKQEAVRGFQVNET